MNRKILLRSIKAALKTCPCDCFIMFIMQLLISTIPVANIYVLKGIIDSLSSRSTGGTFLFIFIYCFMLCIQRAVQDWYNHYFLMYFSLLRFEKKIKIQFFEICQLMRLDDYNDAGLVNHSLRAKNASVNILRLYQACVELVCFFISILAMGIMIRTVNKKLILVFCAICITEVCDNIFKLYQNKKFLYENTQIEKEENEIADLILYAKSMKEIILLNGTQFVLTKWNEVVKQIVQLEKEKNIKILLVSLGTKSFYCIGMLFSYYMLLTSFAAGEVGIGEFSMTISAFIVLKDLFSGLFAEVTNVSQFAIMVTPFFDYLDIIAGRNRTAKQNEEAGSKKICLNKVSYTYHNAEKKALSEIDLVLEQGKKYVIVGENGSGKTTLMKIILGLFQPTEGEISYGNLNVKEWDGNRLYEHYSDVPQEFNMYAVSVVSNIQLSHTNKSLDTDTALREMGLEDLIVKKNERIGKEFGGIELSGGQKQKIAILRAENKKGDVFCLDEPTSAIDPLQEKKIFERIYRVAEGKTTIIVSHRLALCKMADDIIVMKHGKIAETGTHNELMMKNGLYTNMYNEQAQLYKTI